MTEDDDVNGGGQTVLVEGQRGELDIVDMGLIERQTVPTDIDWRTDRQRNSKIYNTICVARR